MPSEGLSHVDRGRRLVLEAGRAELGFPGPLEGTIEEQLDEVLRQLGCAPETSGRRSPATPRELALEVVELYPSAFTLDRWYRVSRWAARPGSQAEAYVRSFERWKRRLRDMLGDGVLSWRRVVDEAPQPFVVYELSARALAWALEVLGELEVEGARLWLGRDPLAGQVAAGAAG